VKHSKTFGITALFVLLAGATLVACGGEAPEAASAAEGLVLGEVAELPTGLPQATVAEFEGLQATLQPVPPRGFVPPNLFCQGFASAVCMNLEPCGCGEETRACIEMIEIDCAGNHGILGPQARRALGAGKLAYDGYAAHRFLRDIADGAQACLGPLEALEWSRGELLSLGGVFSGTAPAGAACDLPYAPFHANDCAEGLCMLDESGNGRCVRTADLGEACDPKTLCVDFDAPVARRDFYVGTLFAFCAPDRAGRPVCQAPARAGNRCSADTHCLSGRCDGKRCLPMAREGEACEVDFDCAAGRCDQGACVNEQLPEGASCAVHEQCASESCYQGKCSTPICRR